MINSLFFLSMFSAFWLWWQQDVKVSPDFPFLFTSSFRIIRCSQFNCEILLQIVQYVMFCVTYTSVDDRRCLKCTYRYSTVTLFTWFIPSCQEVRNPGAEICVPKTILSNLESVLSNRSVFSLLSTA